MKDRRILPALVAVLTVLSCADHSESGTRLTLVGNSVSRILYERGLIPGFKDAYAKAHPGFKVEFTESYDGSGAQLRAIESGLKADIAALSLSPEIDKLAAEGYADKNWAHGVNGALPVTSVVVLEVRAGNPKNIRDWRDILRPDVDVILPNPDTSGAAQWNVAAFDAWALTFAKPGITPAGGENQHVFQLDGDKLRELRDRIKAFGKSGKEAQQIFSGGLGDVLVGWESEALDRKEAGDPIDIVYPSTTIQMEPPVAVITPKGQKTNAAAVEFVQYLSSPAAQRIYAQHHYRPRNPQVMKEFASTFPPVARLMTINDLGGWTEVKKRLFGAEGLWAKSALN